VRHHIPISACVKAEESGGSCQMTALQNFVLRRSRHAPVATAKSALLNETITARGWHVLSGLTTVHGRTRWASIPPPV
jgi:hypothetical protein